jgi:hypothetical protein
LGGRHRMAACHPRADVHSGSNEGPVWGAIADS